MRLNSYSCGSGFPLIILHGLFGSSDNWQTLSRKFGESFTVYAVDLRNHGASPHSDDFDYPSMAEDIREFMNAQDIGEAFVLGHSMGGKTAMQFAATHPNMVRKLIVADIGIKGYPPHHSHIFEALLTLKLEQYSSRAEVDAALAVYLEDVPLRAFLLKNLGRDGDGKLRWKINLPAIHEGYRNIMAPLSAREPFTKPTLFIRGAKSDYILLEDEGSIKKRFPHGEFVSLEGAGHWLHAEKPGEFYAAVMRFLNN